MGLFTFLSELRAARLVDELSQHLARQVYSLLRELCEARVPAMTHAEARGYLWAKARPIVAAEVAAAAGRRPALSRVAVATLQERTHDRVVRSVLADLMRDRVRHVSRRIAA